jgi:G3E family GTPase
MSERIKLDVISGFLGAGKTTLINKLLAEAYGSEKIAVLENEFGEIGVDGDLLSGQNLTVKEITNGCICCTLKGNFVDGIKELAETYGPDRIVIEPTGIGKLGDILEACRLAIKEAPVSLHTVLTVANAATANIFLEVCGEFYLDQIRNSPVIVLSAVQNLSGDDPPLPDILRKIRELNPGALIFSEPWDTLDGLRLLTAAEEASAKSPALLLALPEEHGHHEHHDEDEEHEHDHDQLHENGGFDSCSFIMKEPWTGEDLDDLIARMRDGSFGVVFRAKGFLPVREGYRKLDYVYGKAAIKPADYRGEGKFVVIGRDIRKDDLRRYVEGRHP